MDNLQSITYQTFEQDPVKYRNYEEVRYRRVASLRILMMLRHTPSAQVILLSNPASTLVRISTSDGHSGIGTFNGTFTGTGSSKGTLCYDDFTKLINACSIHCDISESLELCFRDVKGNEVGHFTGSGEELPRDCGKLDAKEASFTFHD